MAARWFVAFRSLEASSRVRACLSPSKAEVAPLEAMEFALLLKQLFTLLLSLHLRREVFGHEEPVALRHVGRARDALRLELEFGCEVHEFRVHATYAVLHGVELDVIDVPLLGELFLQALAVPLELGHGCSVRLWGLAGLRSEDTTNKMVPCLTGCPSVTCFSMSVPACGVYTLINPLFGSR